MSQNAMVVLSLRSQFEHSETEAVVIQSKQTSYLGSVGHRLTLVKTMPIKIIILSVGQKCKKYLDYVDGQEVKVNANWLSLADYLF